MKILFLTSRLPFPPVGGDKLRTFNFIKYLKQKHDLTLVSFIEDQSELEGVAEYQQFYDKLLVVTLPKLVSYKNCLKGLISTKPLQIHYYYSPRMKSLIKEELEYGYDTVFCHLIRMAQYLPVNNGINKVLDLTDAISLNYLRSRRFRRGLFSIINLIESRRVWNYEREAIGKANRSLFISAVDANFLLNGHDERKIKVVPNGVDLDKFQFHRNGYDENTITFVGNMRTFPNSDAAMYFAARVFPLLRRFRPGLKFYVVGNEPTKALRTLHDGKHIFVTGYVDSVVPYLQRSVVMVAPMRAGAGIQNKILEAMAVGTPVVTTAIGVEGLDRDVIKVADTPEEMCQHIVALIKDKEQRRKKSIQARKYIEANFTWEQNLKNLDECLFNGHSE